MIPGFYPGLSYSAYEKLGGLRASSLWSLVRQTPAHYLARRREPMEPTPAMAFGTEFHTLILEPGRFAREYVTGGPINPKTGKAYGRGTKAWAGWEAAHPGIKAISEEDMARLRRMEAEIHDHDTAPHILNRCRDREISILWRDEETGLMLQGRLDLWAPVSGFFADLKTTKSADPRRFANAAEEYGYFMQVAMYRCGIETLTGREATGCFLLSETESPYLAAVREIGKAGFDHGRVQLRKALQRYAIYAPRDKWPGYPGVTEIAPPAWAVDRPYEVIE